MEEDLGIKIGTKEEAFWTDVAEKTEREIETLEKLLKFNKAILKMSKEKCQEEKNLKKK
jgi:Mg2+ and Co2+ transporter CorA